MSWRRIRVLVWKEFTQIRRDKSMLPLILIMPVIQLILFGYVVGADVRNLSPAVYDQDRSIQSQRVVDAFTSSGYFTLTANPATDAQLKDTIDGGTAVIAVVIPKGLGDAVRQKRPAQIGLIVDGSDSRTSQVANGYAQGIVANLSSQFYPQPGVLPGTTTALGVNYQVRVLYNPTMRAVNTMVPALLAFILLMSTQNLMSQAIVKERERGTLEQLFVTPIGRTDYLLGKQQLAQQVVRPPDRRHEQLLERPALPLLHDRLAHEVLRGHEQDEGEECRDHGVDRAHRRVVEHADLVVDPQCRGGARFHPRLRIELVAQVGHDPCRVPVGHLARAAVGAVDDETYLRRALLADRVAEPLGDDDRDDRGAAVDR